jgi:hypothetical protein
VLGEQRRDDVGPQADPHLRRAELRVLARHQQVARERDTEATGQGVSVDPPDERDPQPGDRGEQLAQHPALVVLFDHARVPRQTRRRGPRRRRTRGHQRR